MKTKTKNINLIVLDLLNIAIKKNGKNNVPHSSSDIWKNGLPGDGSAGDIACWNGHVGICDGSGNVIHCYYDNRIIVAHPISQINQWNGPLKGYRRF